MEQIKQALFQQMRFSILSTAFPSRDESPFSNAYLYAWERSVYPLHDGGHWHEPHEEQFSVREAEIEELNMFLVKRWDDKKPITFYELEDHYDVRTKGPWDRGKLIGVCRYMFLHKLFDEQFWQALTENGKCPTEAHSVTDPHEDTLYFQ